MATQYSGISKIVVAGIGGAGINSAALVHGVHPGIVHVAAIDTDPQSIESSDAETTVTIGDGNGGAGGNPDAGRNAAEAAEESIRAVFSDADVAFVLAGLGGGTGSGAGPVCARIARECGALVFVVAIRPFSFEGDRRDELSKSSITAFVEAGDTLILFSNNELLKLGPRANMMGAFGQMNTEIAKDVTRICAMLIEPGIVNIDIQDLRRVVGGAGLALVGTGIGESATEAVTLAIANALARSPSSELRSSAERTLIHIRARDLPPLPDIESAVGIARNECGGGDVIWGASPISDDATDVSALLIVAFAEEAPAEDRNFGSGVLAAAPEPEATEPKAAEPEVTEPKAAEPEAIEPEVAEPEVIEPEAAEPEAAEPEAAGSIGDAAVFLRRTRKPNGDATSPDND